MANTSKPPTDDQPEQAPAGARPPTEQQGRDPGPGPQTPEGQVPPADDRPSLGPQAPERPADADASAEALRHEGPERLAGNSVVNPQIISRDDQIRAWARALWEQAGRPEGQDDEFWHQAEAAYRREELLNTPGGKNDVRRVGVPQVDDFAERQSVVGQEPETKK